MGMRYVLLMFFISLFVYGAPIELENNKIAFSVMDGGAIGTGIESNGNQNEHKNGIRVLGTSVDHVNSLGIPFEFFSLAFGGKVYANDNAEGYEKRWPPKDRRANSSNMPTAISSHNQSIKAVTTLDSQFTITHLYTLNETRILIDVIVTNHSSGNKRVQYVRGIDMDPGSVYTDCQKGFSGNVEGKNVTIPASDLIYTIRSDNKLYPLSLFSDEKNITRQTVITAFDGTKGCLYDPNEIRRKDKGNSYNAHDGVAYMIFDLGEMAPGASKTFKFQYILDNNLLDLIKKVYEGYLEKSEVIIGDQNIIYKRTEVYEKASEGTFVMKQKSGEPDTKKHKAKMFLNNGLLSRVPDGLSVRINGNEISKDNAVEFTFKYGKPVKYEIWRNKDFKEEKKSIIPLIVKKEKGMDDEINIPIVPVGRNIGIAFDRGNLNVPLKELGDLAPLEMTVSVDGLEISKEEYEESEIETRLEGISWDLLPSENGRKRIQIEPKSYWPLCLNPTGDHVIAVTIKNVGGYPLDKAQKDFSLHIKKPETLLEWWEVCSAFIKKTLLTIFVLWYLFGLYSKNKFCKNQQIESKRIIAGDQYVLTGIIKFTKKVPFWQKFIPYKPEWVRYSNMVFIASSVCNSVYLSKISQYGIEIDGTEIDSAGRKHIRVYSGSTISTGSDEYNLN